MEDSAWQSSARDIRGALHMILSAVSLVTGIAIIRMLTAYLPEQVIVLSRFALALVFFGPSLGAIGVGVLRTRRLGAHALRAACGYAGFLAFVYAAARMPLADAMALGFTQPLWAALIAALAFGERLGVVRLAALATGFAGAMLVLKPGVMAAPLLPSLAALANAVLTSVAMMTVKRLSTTEPTSRIAFMFLLVASLLSVPPAAAVWVTPAPELLPWLLATGALAWLSQVGLTRGYALGRFSAMAAMDFARLPAALAIGWIAFGEVPDLAAAIGMGLIGVASTAIVLWQPRAAVSRPGE